VRATISDMGPVLLARLLNLNDTQAGVLQLVFRIADDNGLLLLDLKDLRAMMQHVGENAKTSPPSTAMSRRRRSAPSSAAC
jgi:DNA helicase HerA-like ATPase